MQHDAGPARPKHDIHLSRGRRQRFEIGQRLAHGLVRGLLPRPGLQKAYKILAPAVTIAARLLAITLASHHRYIDAHEGAHVPVAFAVCAQNLDHLPSGAQ